MAEAGVQHGVDLEAREDDRRRAGQERPMEPHPEAVQVEQGEGQDEAIVLGPPPRQPEPFGAGQQVAVA
jgi:hypothetical protein